MRVFLLASLAVASAHGCAPEPTSPTPTRAELVEAFRLLGADDPESWAASQVEEGIPQLERFLFLREAWRGIIREDDREWIQFEIRAARNQPERPLAGAGLALARMKALGVSDEDINEVVRVMQYKSVFDVLYAMGNPPEEVRGVPLADRVYWGLYRADPDTDNPAKPYSAISGLYESFLKADPTGRQMRPRNRTP